MADEGDRGCNREFTQTLLSLYRGAPELWKVKSKEYHDKKKKALAVTRITNALKAMDGTFTEQDFKKKINILRTNFNKCRKTIQAMSAEHPDQTFEPKLWYYNAMTFLLDSSETDISGNLQPSEEDFYEDEEEQSFKQPIDNCYTLLEDYQPEIVKYKRKKNNDSKRASSHMAISYLNDDDEELEIMAKGWAIQMKKLSGDQQLFARKIINDVLFEGAMGTLSRNGVQFLPDSCVNPIQLPMCKDSP